MRTRATVQGDEEGAYVVFPQDFPLPFGADEDVILEQIGDTIHITRAADKATRNEYRAKLDLPDGD